MTNKKFKVAAMSVALTACVAAQPLIANAADETGTVPSDNGSEPTMDTVSSTSAETGTSAQSEPEEIKNEESKESVSTTGGEDVTVDYDHNEDKVTDNEDGSTTTDSTGTVNRDVSDEEHPDGQDPDGNVDGGKGGGSSSGAGGEQDGPESGTPESDNDKKEVVPPSDDEKKTIGTAEKSETESKETDLILGETTTETTTTTNQDGSTTTTTTTTTDATLETKTDVKGEANAKTDETFHEDVKDTLSDELGGGKLSWDTKADETFGDYTVSSVGEEKDGQKQFTLTKEDKEETGEMTGEDIAKLIEAGYTDNGDGTYTLTKEYTDSKGQKQTTTIKVDSSSATKTTSTTLTITLESQKHTTPEESFGDEDKPYEGISEDITVKGDNGKEYKFKLKDILDKATDKDGTLTYEDTANNLTYTIKKSETSEALDNLSNTELRDLLNERTGGTSYSVDKDGNLCYTTDKGEVCRVNEEQNTLLRSFLKLDISITDHHGKESDTKVDGSNKSPDEAKADAQKEAQEKALRDALAKAIEKETGKKPADTEIDLSKAKDGKFEWTDETTGKTYTYTFTYNVTEGTPSVAPTTKDGASSAEKNTENATAEVTGSTVIWTEEGKTHTDDNVKNLFGDGYDFTKETEGKLTLAGKADYNEDGTLKSFTTTDGKAYTFEYSQGTAPEGLGDISDAKFTNVTWKITEKVSEPKTVTDDSETTVIQIKQDWSMTKEEGKDSFSFTDGKNTYTGLKPVNGKDGVYTNADNTVTVTVDTRTLTIGEIEDQIKQKFTGATNIVVKPDGTARYTIDGVTYNATYSYTVKTATVKEQVKGPTSTVTASSTDQKAAREELKEKIKALQNSLKDGEYLEVNGHRVEKTTKIETVISYFDTVINYKELSDEALVALLKKQKADADAAGKSYTGSGVEHNPWADGGHNVQGESDKNKPNYIGHLDLATDSDLTLKDGSSADAILLNDYDKKFTLEWNTSADDLVAGKGNRTAKFADNITLDPGKMEDGSGSGDLAHYEYNRKYGNTWIAPDTNDYPHQSAYYRLTGTIAYGSLDGNEYTTREAAQAALDKWKSQNPDDADYKPNIVTLQKTTTDKYGRKTTITVYKPYKYESSLTAYGYMSKDSNTCVNSGYGKDSNGKSWWTGGFDLRISGLTQVTKTETTAHGKNYFDYSADITTVSSKTSQGMTNSSLTVSPGTKTTTELVDKETGGGTGLFGSYDLKHSENLNTSVTGSGSSDYTTYRTWEDAKATWADTLEKITGAFRGKYTSTADATVAEAVKETTVHTESEVKYHYSYVEHEELEPIVDIKTVTTTPDGGGDITEENTPDAPVLPSNPELPPVQDARPDVPVLPSDPVLPPVQDARMDAALPQTGVDWLTAIGLAFSGMTLMAAGAWASLTGKKAKH